MQICPKCGAQNPDGRAACVVCFAQLPKTVPERGTREQKQPKEQTVVETAVTAPAREKPEETVSISQTPKTEPSPGVQQPVGLQEPPPQAQTEESEAEQTGVPRFVLDEEEETVVSTESKRAPYDLEAQAEEKQSAPVAPKEDESPHPGRVEGLSKEQQAEVQSEQRTGARAESATTRTQKDFSVREARMRARARLAEKQRKRPFVPVVIILVVLAVIVTWYFTWGSPSPADSAKAFVIAVNALYAGDMTPLKMICSANSSSSITSRDEVLRSLLPANLPVLGLSPGTVESVQVAGKTAEVKLKVRYALLETHSVGDITMRVALVKEGSFIKPRWKVDLAATERLQQQEKAALENLADQLKSSAPPNPAVPGLSPQ